MRDKLFAVLWCASTFAIAQPVERETIAKPQTEKDQKKRDRKLRKELESPFQVWEKVDVGYIITDEERQAFHQLSNDAEREQFIEQFWLRRDPTPDTEENEFKEEHYRRLAYANEHFASGVPGWKTDRGMIYIKFGPPDEIEAHPSGGSYQQSPEEGTEQITTFPFERWRYRYIENIGTNIVIEFVDQTMTGEYHITIDPTEKNALLHTPMGQPQQQSVPGAASSFRNEFDSLELQHNLMKPPSIIKNKDLEAAVNVTVRYNTLPMRVRADYIPITPASIFTYITLQIDSNDLQFQEKDGVRKAVVNLYARITTVSRRVANVFEDVLSVESPTGQALYQKAVPLAPGRYRLNIAAKDVTGGNTGTYEMVLDVPTFEEDKLAASSLILADLMEPVPPKSIRSGPFVIGDTKVRPRVNATFRADETLGAYAQLFHFAPEGNSRKANGVVRCQITRHDTREVVFDETDEASSLKGSATEMTLQKRLPLTGLAPGPYTLQMTVEDSIKGQTLTRSAPFSIVAR
jgi:GWxTD domain-containing protein